ncbi:MAG: hypothetical protein QXS54_12400 [Candidatus Methanomethylicaceae archaeon]
MPISINPQDEDKVVSMILRDARRVISRRQPKADFSKSKVKFQKIVFLVAEELEIPITRSWYLYGGYVHSDLVDIETIKSLEDDQPATFDLFNQKITPTEKPIKPEDVGLRPDKYHAAVERIAPEVFFSKLERFLVEFYKKAPEPYKNFYLSNTELNRKLKELEDRSEVSMTGLDSYLDNLPSSAIYDQISPIVSDLLVGFAKESFDETYDALYRFSGILESYAIELGFGRKGFQRIGYLREFYNSSIWKTAALRFSIETVKGIRADEVRAKQQGKLESLLRSLPHQLENLELELKMDGLMPSYRKMVEFYEKRYGRGRDLVRALVEAARINE